MPDGDCDAEPVSGGAPQNQEPLACVACRARKLKCDRVKPACGRCVKLSADCVYPESRRKPAFKRRSAKELEARLAQVETLLKDVSKAGREKKRSGGALDPVPEGPRCEPERPTSQDANGGDTEFPGPQPALPFVLPAYQLGMEDARSKEANEYSELMGLGMSEAPPPFEMVEELHNAFFEKQQMFIPIVHPGRYLKAYHSAPHLRPPMCLQYAIWAMAANCHEKYNSYHDIFYRRSRQYLEADELRDHGEHFITTSHAQAWALTATYEARCMLFTRAAMSSARCARLVCMLGLHRLDDPAASGSMVPTLSPPKDWTELEERRRILWGAFCIDCHASISTGWPTLLKPEDITTHLPSSEEAFNRGKEQKSHSLTDVFSGASYSAFAGAVLMCHIFGQILKHGHGLRPEDRPEDYDYGKFWARHRELDNKLSSVFIFLPERFRLPKNIRDPVAVHTNLNLHAAVICLHNAACEQADVHKLPAHIKKASEDRLLTAAQEIVSILKLTSHMHSAYRSPLVALSMYCATSVFVYRAMDDSGPADVDSLEFLVKCMEAIGREHLVTRAFLQQAILDVQRNGISLSVSIPWFDHMSGEFAPCGHNIPILARSSVSRHSKVQPLLPGRLPLDNPIGNAYGRHTNDCCPPIITDVFRVHGLEGAYDDPAHTESAREKAASNKRRRMKSPEVNNLFDLMTKTNMVGAVPASSSVPGSSQRTAPFPPVSVLSGIADMRLPHRPGTPSSSSPSATRDTPSTLAGSSADTPGLSRVETMTGTAPSPKRTTEAHAHQHGREPEANVDMFAGMENWDMADGGSMYAQLVDVMRDGSFEGLGESDPWALLHGADGSWHAGGDAG